MSTGSALPGTTGKPAFIFYSDARGHWLCARESAGALHLFTTGKNPVGPWTDRGVIHTSPTAGCTFVDFPGATAKVVLSAFLAGSTAGATYTWDGATLTNVTGLQGSALVLWENKVWMLGYPTSSAFGTPATFFACAPGDPTTWPPGANTLKVDVRIKDGAALVAGAVVGGSLVLFKQRSAYRVSDFASGAHDLIDPSAGCIGAYALASAHGRVITWGVDGLYEWDGSGKAKNIGDKLRTLFATDPAMVAGVPLLCGGPLDDRLMFAYPSSAGGDNDRLLEVDPIRGWAMRHQLALASADNVTSFARFEGSGTAAAGLYAAIADADAIYQIKTVGPAGKDDATIQATASYRTPWLQPNGGKPFRLHRLLVEGLLSWSGGSSGGDTVVVRVYKDFDLSSFTDYDITALGRNVAIGGGGQFSQLNVAELLDLGFARAFCFEFRATRIGSPSPQVLINGLMGEWLSVER